MTVLVLVMVAARLSRTLWVDRIVEDRQAPTSSSNYTRPYRDEVLNGPKSQPAIQQLHKVASALGPSETTAERTEWRHVAS